MAAAETRVEDAAAIKAPYVLGYWNTRALAEPIRLLLVFVGVNWEDKRYQVGSPSTYDKSAWENEKETLGLSLPNLPYLLNPETGLKLTQTRTILRYLWRMHGPRDTMSWEEELRADMACEFLFEWWANMFDVTYCDAPCVRYDVWDKLADKSRHADGLPQCQSGGARFDALLHEYSTTTLPRYLRRVSSFLSEASAEVGGSGQTGSRWLAGSHISYADFVLFELLDTHLLLAPTCLDGFEVLRDLWQRFLALPRIASYRAQVCLLSGSAL